MGATGGVLTGMNPLQFNSSNPLPLFLVQVVIIICTCRVLAFGLAKLRQPAVIAEVIGGIILGPTALGRIPGFANTLFPKQSLDFLNLVANLGLVLFLFLVGLELDPKMLKASARRSLTISLAGVLLPFGAGIGVSYALFNLLGDTSQNFVSFFLFLGVAMAITAFPVLARILTELKLLKTYVGSVTISAAAVDDAASWCMLALVISIINAANSLTALYVFLCTVGYTLFLVFVIRPILIKILRHTGSLENGPSRFAVFLAFLVVLISAFFTDIIGVHAIFGGFLAGLIMPHEGGFAAKLTEKIEDVVTILLLPLYFTLSGLKTQIGLLNDGTSWGFVFLVIFVACAGKITGCTFAARFDGMSWRESLAVGVLMNCKGLVELIVLNLGLEARVINEKIFAIMVLMALVTTFMTTPLVMWIYPPKYRNMDKKSINEEEGRESTQNDRNSPVPVHDDMKQKSQRVLMCLNKMNHVPTMMTLVQLISPLTDTTSKSQSLAHTSGLGEEEGSNTMTRPFSFYALRLMELTDRTSAIMMYSESSEAIQRDPVMNVFRIFGQLSGINIKSFIKTLYQNEFAQTVIAQAQEVSADLVMLPWAGSGSMTDDPALDPMEELLQETKHTSYQHALFILDTFELSECAVSVFVDRGFSMDEKSQPEIEAIGLESPAVHGHLKTNQQIYLPFFGGPDDREALEFVIRLTAKNPNLNVTVIRFRRNADMHSPNPTDEHTKSGPSNTTLLTLQESPSIDKPQVFSTTHGSKETIASYVQVNIGPASKISIISSEQDDKLFAKYFSDHSSSMDFKQRLSLEVVETGTPLSSAVNVLNSRVGSKDLVIVGRGRLQPAAHWNHGVDMNYKDVLPTSNTDRHRCLGNVAEAMLHNGCKGSLLVVQSAKASSSG